MVKLQKSSEDVAWQGAACDLSVAKVRCGRSRESWSAAGSWQMQVWPNIAAEEGVWGMKSADAAFPPHPREGSWGSQQRGHLVLHPSPWSSRGGSELLCHLLRVQKTCDTIPMLWGVSGKDLAR